MVKRLLLRNYRSIRACDINLTPLTMIVGRNAVGKSNLVDALRFVRDALVNQLDFALRERGGVDEVRRRARGAQGRRPNFTIELDLTLPSGSARYGFTITTVHGGALEVARETCECEEDGRPAGSFRVERGEVTQFSTLDQPEALFQIRQTAPVAAASDRLYLVSVSNLPVFRPIFDALSRMAFHNLNPEAMKRPQRPEPGSLLAHDGHNLASVIKHLTEGRALVKERVIEYLRAIGVQIDDFKVQSLQGYETVEFEQRVPGVDRPWKFDASAMSDGTMRAVGILVSLLSSAGSTTAGPTLVAVEEPETALHPAAAGALFDAIAEASEKTQVMVTCHSPDLLDQPGLSPDSIIAAVLDEKGSRFGPLSPAKRDLLDRHLHTAGELLRIDQLTPDPEVLDREDTPSLFEDHE